jgi:acylphosphatase
MIRAKIVAEGDVQKAGYRDEVQKIARELGVKGFVENLRDGRVGIVCEARGEVIDKFVKKIKIKKDFIDVKEVNISEKTKSTGEFEYFDIKYGKIEEELGDRLGAAIKYAGGTWEEVKCSREDIKDVRDEVKGFRDETKTEFQTIKTDYGKISQDLGKAVNSINTIAMSIEKLAEAIAKK